MSDSDTFSVNFGEGGTVKELKLNRSRMVFSTMREEKDDAPLPPMEILTVEMLRHRMESNAKNVFHTSRARQEVDRRSVYVDEYKCGLVSPDGDIIPDESKAIVLTQTWKMLQKRFPTDWILWRVTPTWNFHQDPLTGNNVVWTRFRMSLAEDGNTAGGRSYSRFGRLRRGKVRWKNVSE